MPRSYILKGTENEYLLVIRAEDEKSVLKIIDQLSSSRTEFIKELASELEKSLNDNGRDTSKTRSKNKSKSTTSNKGKRREAENS